MFSRLDNLEHRSANMQKISDVHMRGSDDPCRFEAWQMLTNITNAGAATQQGAMRQGGGGQGEAGGGDLWMTSHAVAGHYRGLHCLMSQCWPVFLWLEGGRGGEEVRVGWPRGHWRGWLLTQPCYQVSLNCACAKANAMQRTLMVLLHCSSSNTASLYYNCSARVSLLVSKHLTSDICFI